MDLRVKRLTSTAKMPTRAYSNDAGIDLYSDEPVELWPFEPKRVITNIAVQIPAGYYGLISDRSGLGSRGIHVLAGTVDSSYRGNVTICLILLDKGGYANFEAGTKLAQMTIHPVPYVQISEVAELPESDRGISGFGSSGL